MVVNCGCLAPGDVTTALWFYAGLEGEGDIHLVNEEDYLVTALPIL